MFFNTYESLMVSHTTQRNGASILEQNCAVGKTVIGQQVVALDRTQLSHLVLVVDDDGVNVQWCPIRARLEKDLGIQQAKATC
ncbi:hypothetical protein TNCV_2446981 [Trichonephila clavipes]|nr:hypothetical protein TNCV_2446981 [Trichonephila clavipes]